MRKSVVRDATQRNPAPVDYNKHLGRIDRIPMLSRIVMMFEQNRKALGLREAPSEELEQTCFLIYDSMEAPTRTFHTIEHLFDLHYGADPIQTSAIAFHDIIYYQIDGGLSERQSRCLHDIFIVQNGKLFITKHKLEPSIEVVMDVFGFEYGQYLDPFKGMNEFLSACVAARVHAGIDGDSKYNQALNAKRSACIEMTIPFRKENAQGKRTVDVLYDRLCKMNDKYDFGWDEPEIVQAVQRAADLGNRDLANFAWKDHAAFLSNTWKLLPESNVKLRTTAFYLSDMQSALFKMVNFFSHLDPTSLFIAFRDPKEEKKQEANTKEATRNIRCARSYVASKFIGISILCAIADLTGGDTPCQHFTGDRKNTPHRKNSDQIHFYLDWLKKPERGVTCDRDVMKVLRKGRKEEDNFDSRNSPLGAFVYSYLGDEGLDAALKYAECPMDAMHGRIFLEHLPMKMVIELIVAASKTCLIRKEKILNIIEELPSGFQEKYDAMYVQGEDVSELTMSSVSSTESIRSAVQRSLNSIKENNCLSFMK
jgi:hypothetical protein